nr:YetF domain-containing protein [Roseococcus sp. MDT2-1-1]
MLGSILSRAINGSAPFLPTVLAAAALVAVHWVLAFVALHTSIGSVFKGEPQLLIKDGQVREEAMRGAKITSADLDEALRINAKHTDRSRIRRAYLERNGSISVIPYPSEPQVLEVSVKDGVQSVRIKLE